VTVLLFVTLFFNIKREREGIINDIVKKGMEIIEATSEVHKV
jgi:hypothetical protein